MSTPVTGQFKTWGELLLAALTQKREIQGNFGGEWRRSALNDAIQQGDAVGMLGPVADYRLKPKTQKVYFGYSPASYSEELGHPIKHWATDFYADEALARKDAPNHWRIGTAEIEVNE